MGKPARASRRAPLSREVVLRSAVALADHAGIEVVIESNPQNPTGWTIAPTASRSMLRAVRRA